MPRLAYLLVPLVAACGGGVETEMATLSNTDPPVKSASARTFTGADGGGNMVLGWKIDLWADGPGADCTSEDNKRVGTIGIFTNQAAGSKPQAILAVGGISIVTMSPPMLVASAAANVGLEGVANIQGQLTIDEFHLTADAMHADRIKGTVSAGGEDPGTNEAVSLTGSFSAPVCTE